jgi:hypothetical protein
MIGPLAASARECACLDATKDHGVECAVDFKFSHTCFYWGVGLCIARRRTARQSVEGSSTRKTQTADPQSGSAVE